MIENEIKKRLLFLEPEKLILNNESELHKNHPGNTGGEHYNLVIMSKKFKGKSRIQRHQIIYQALNELIPDKIHALSIKALTIEEG